MRWGLCRYICSLSAAFFGNKLSFTSSLHCDTINSFDPVIIGATFSMPRLQWICSFLGLLSLVADADASYAKNLNYRSPSENHPSLGISIHKVNKRNEPAKAYAPSQLNFTHGVASGGTFD